jgi:hypothetical protein
MGSHLSQYRSCDEQLNRGKTVSTKVLDCQTEIAAETELNLQMNGSTSAPQNKSDFKSSQKTDVVTETLNES